MTEIGNLNKRIILTSWSDEISRSIRYNKDNHVTRRYTERNKDDKIKEKQITMPSNNVIKSNVTRNNILEMNYKIPENVLN
jgi:hypothetical protein